MRGGDRAAIAAGTEKCSRIRSVSRGLSRIAVRAIHSWVHSRGQSRRGTAWRDSGVKKHIDIVSKDRAGEGAGPRNRIPGTEQERDSGTRQQAMKHGYLSSRSCIRRRFPVRIPGMRKPRLLISGALYHVTARANRKELVLQPSQIKVLFLEVLSKAKRRFKFTLDNFCIMGNHIHLLIRPQSECSLSRLMQWVLSVFARAYNRLHGLVGHV